MSTEPSRTRDALWRELDRISADGSFARVQDLLYALPASSPVLSKVLPLLGSEGGSWQEVAKAVSTDPVVAGKVLGLANSAGLGARTPASSIQAACGRLGTTRLMQVVVAASVAFLGEKRLPGYDITPDEMWRCSLTGAFAAEYLARRQGLSPAFGYTAGLLANVGKLVLAQLFDVDDALHAEAPFGVFERAQTGLDHALVSAWLLREWGLPDELVLAVRYHHDPRPAISELGDVVHAARYVACHICSVGVDGMRYPLHPEVGEALFPGRELETTLMAVSSMIMESELMNGFD